MPNTLPFGTQFSPNQIELPQLLQLIIDNEGDDTAPLITAIGHFFQYECCGAATEYGRKLQKFFSFVWNS